MFSTSESRVFAQPPPGGRERRPASAIKRRAGKADPFASEGES